ncbi:MAG: alpha/beta fold hydrolase [Candidatus Acidiferrum sp.]|jgi:pimeloyl-ACP methyl ester carboxylesterase
MATGLPRKIRSRRLLLVFAAFIVLWVAIGFISTIPVAGNHTYWRTFRGLPGDFGLKAENVSFVSEDGIALKGWYIRSQGVARGTVIVAHGINGNRSDMLSRAAFLVRGNYNTLLIDLRDHGESGGNYAGPGYMESRDILGALKYLQKRGETGPIAAMGHSYGAVAALYATAQSPDIIAVIADGAFISFDDMVKRATILLAKDPERSFLERLGLRLARFRVTEWAVKPMYYLRTGVWLNSREADSLVAISDIGNRPILFISGARDEICPPQNARLMYNEARSPEKQLLVIANAEHDTTYQTAPELYESTVVRFLEEAFHRAAASGERSKRNDDQS